MNGAVRRESNPPPDCADDSRCMMWRFDVSRVARLLLGLAALLLIGSFFLPLWKITLDAPQYPEGLGLYIKINTITGIKPHDLMNINGLNHYIGMKAIEPDSIAELRIMPYLVAALVLLALAGVVTGSRRVLYVWLILFIVLGIAGMVDFYLWGYDYGHNLDFEHAAIKVPGMAYQPPLLGTKKLLNFTASSYPAAGGWLLVLSMALGFVSLFISNGKTPGRLLKRRTQGMPAIVAAMLCLGMVAACTPAPEPLVLGQDACSHCKMTIMDKKYGAELLTAKGKVYKFDAIECLAAFQNSGTIPADQVHALLVVDFNNPDRFVRVEEARFLVSEKLHSPMSMNFAAFMDQSAAENAQETFGGEILDWQEILQHVRRQWQGASMQQESSMQQ